MTDLIKPTDLEGRIWAEDGTITSPDTIDILEGWEVGEKPPAQFFNYWQNRTDKILTYLNQKGIPEWDINTPYIAFKSFVTQAGNLYVAKQDHDGESPALDVTFVYWKLLLSVEGAMAADREAFLLARANHTGFQATSTVTGLDAALAAKEVTSNKVTTFASPNDTTYPTTLAVSNLVGGSGSGSPLLGWEATSTSSFTPTIGDNSLILVESGKAFTVGQFVTVADVTLLHDNYFVGIVKTFDSVTGAMVVTSKTVVGGTSASSWAITASAASKGERFVSPVQSFVALGNVSGTVNIDLRVALKYSMTLTGNTTLTFTMPDIFSATTETWASLLITKGGSYSLAFPAGSQWNDGAAPVPASGTKNEYLGTKQGTDNWIWSIARKSIA